MVAAHRAPELKTVRVTDADGLDAHRRAVSEGFGADRAVALGTTCIDLLDRPECVVYVGYAGGAPVVSGLGWRTGRTIGVSSISTVESARRRGYGAAMTARVMADGLVAGCDVADSRRARRAPDLRAPGFPNGYQVRAYSDRGER